MTHAKYFIESPTIKIVVFIILSMICIKAPAFADEPANPVRTGRVEAPDNDPVKTCMAAQSMIPVEEKKNGPVRLVAKALASEAKTNASDMLKDTIFVFSAKDIDPYDQGPPKNKPYTALEIRLIDGSSARLIKYPDNSGKIEGGFADGTIIAPSGTNTFIVAYPNGVRGKMVKLSNAEYKIYRPDNSITTIKQTVSGGYTMSNDKIGYMGTARPDRLGMQYEFNTKDF
jgi:hypothetical protein